MLLTPHNTQDHPTQQRIIWPNVPTTPITAPTEVEKLMEGDLEADKGLNTKAGTEGQRDRAQAQAQFRPQNSKKAQESETPRTSEGWKKGASENKILLSQEAHSDTPPAERH